MLYASELFRQLNRGKIAIEDNPEDIPDLVAEFLARLVERRLRRNLVSATDRKRQCLVVFVGISISLKTERLQLLARKGCLPI